MSEDLKDLYEEEKELVKERKDKRKKRRAHDLGNFISGVIIVICVVVFCVSAVKLLQIYNEYKSASDEYTDLALLIPTVEATTEETTEVKETTETDAETLEEQQTQEIITTEEVIVPAPVFMDGVDWQGLYNTMYAINNDYEAWIYIAGTKINYPIVQGADNDFYLTHTFQREPVFSASLFIDYRVEGGAEGRNVIVYGHNMKDGSMFAALKKFRQESFRKRHPSFSVYTNTGAYEYQVFSSYTTSPVSTTYTVGFGSDEEYMDYINRMISWSEADYGVDVTAQDKIITLSTCVNNNQQRYVVHAKRVN